MNLYRHLRIFLFIILFLGLGAYLWATKPWVVAAPPNYAETIEKGKPLVAAIYQFKADRGLWPEYLDDLSPAYLPAAPGREWSYELQQASNNPKNPDAPHWLPALATPVAADGPHARLAYDFDPVNPKWSVIGGAHDRTLRQLSPPEVAPSSPAAASNPGDPYNPHVAAELAELDRRIARETTVIEHRQGKATLLLSLNRRQDARQAIQQAQADLPKNSWPRLALASLDTLDHGVASEDKLPDSAKDFVQWVTQNPSFTHDYYLWLFYRQLGLAKAADRTVLQALRQPIATAADDPQVIEFYLWDLARYCLGTNQLEPAIELCNAWERIEKNKPPGAEQENSYLALRAAANLQRGDEATAAMDLDALSAQGSATWAADAYKLQEALDQHNHAFHYQPGNSPASYQVFSMPE